MLMLHSLQFVMLIVAVLLLRRRFGALVFLVIFAISVYFLSFDRGVPQWLATGEQHYALQQQMNDMGGVPTIIARIKQRLALNPDDATGWMILGKLYKSQQDETAANNAFAHAAALANNAPPKK